MPSITHVVSKLAMVPLCHITRAGRRITGSSPAAGSAVGHARHIGPPAAELPVRWPDPVPPLQDAPPSVAAPPTPPACLKSNHLGFRTHVQMRESAVPSWQSRIPPVSGKSGKCLVRGLIRCCTPTRARCWAAAARRSAAPAAARCPSAAWRASSTADEADASALP